eukprot:TRINITY_DN50003_c0_g1_i1.p1 TRINITY_DN50003_c0_g1~~TRINITY_DN50003_c0_g1_i1.p1  ORF type:complete len:407 (+),score=134.28 TRINITY_DN50003_c0_g1_i1:80-1222(+)
MAAADGDEREATVLLQVDDVAVSEVKGRQKNRLDGGEMTMLRVPATPEELARLAELGLCDPAHDGSTGVVFVVCGEHKVPLTPRIPVLRQEVRQYTFVMPGLFLEFALPPDTDPEEIEVFEALLQQNTSLRVRGGPPAVPATAVVAVTREGGVVGPSVGDRIAVHISGAGQKVVQVIAGATPKVQGGIQSASSAAQQRVAPRETPVELDEATIARLQRTRLVTRNGVLISGQLAKAMVGVAQQIGKVLASHASTSGVGQRAGGDPRVEEVKKVAQAGVGAAVGVMEAGTQAFKTVLTSSVDGLSQVVEHRYGEQAGGACRDGLGCVTDVVETGLNMRAVGVKGLAKVAGKEAAKSILDDDVPQQQQQRGEPSRVEVLPDP